MQCLALEDVMAPIAVCSIQAQMGEKIPSLSDPLCPDAPLPVGVSGHLTSSHA